MLQRTLFVTWVALVWLWGRAWHPGQDPQGRGNCIWARTLSGLTPQVWRWSLARRMTAGFVCSCAPCQPLWAGPGFLTCQEPQAFGGLRSPLTPNKWQWRGGGSLALLSLQLGPKPFPLLFWGQKALTA